MGDALIALGIGWFLFSSLARRQSTAGEGAVALGPGGSAFAELDQPMVLGSVRGPAGAEALIALRPRRRHPYVRLALDARFASFWLAQAISLFGDRLHQVALAVLALAITDSPLATGLVFLAATLPNLCWGPSPVRSWTAGTSAG